MFRAEIEVTNHCNIRCAHCPHESVTRPKGMMTWETFETVSSKIRNHVGGERYALSFSGMGEPLLNPELYRFISAVSAEASTSFATNGSALNETNVRKLIDAGLDSIFLSINGDDADVFSRMMGGLSIDRVMTNVRGAVASARGTPLKVKANVSITRINRDRVTRIREMVEAQGVAPVTFSLCHSRGGNLKDADICDTPAAPIDAWPCDVLENTLFVDWRGRAYICDHDIHGEHELGDLAVEPLATILERKRQLLDKGVSLEICRNCNDVMRIGGSELLPGGRGGVFRDWLYDLHRSDYKPLSAANPALRWIYGIYEKEGRTDRFVNRLLEADRSLHDEHERMKTAKNGHIENLEKEKRLAQQHIDNLERMRGLTDQHVANLERALDNVRRIEARGRRLGVVRGIAKALRRIAPVIARQPHDETRATVENVERSDASPMETRELGRTGIRLSVIGIGTSQLQMVPERQAIATLVRGFELGVNWVHTAPDYGGIDPWIRAAIDRSGREVMVATSGPERNADLEAFFENTCHVYSSPRLALYGLAGIEDLEWRGENVWRSGGMIEFLQRKKGEGRIGALYCTTHGSPKYAARLIDSGVFDAIMLSWNPLGYHQQSQAGSRAKLGRDHEDLEEFRQWVFPLAAERGVSVLVMRPLAGGMLLPSKAFPRRADLEASPKAESSFSAADVLRMALDLPGVCSVVPGTASVAEVEENARAGHAPLASARRARRTRRGVDRVAAELRTSMCSHCGLCEPTCSQNLPLMTMFRDARIWTLGSELNQPNAAENYFDLHPATELACTSCNKRSCVCPQRIDIPAALGRAHDAMLQLRDAGLHPGPSAALPARVRGERHKVLVLSADVPTRLEAGVAGSVRFVLRNAGDERWLAPQHSTHPAWALGIAVIVDGAVSSVVPLRNTINVNEAFSTLAFELPVLLKRGSYQLSFALGALQRMATEPATRTEFHVCTVVVEGEGIAGVADDPSREARAGNVGTIDDVAGSPSSDSLVASAEALAYVPESSGAEPAQAMAQVVDAPAPLVIECLEHGFPATMDNGSACAALIVFRNAGSSAWRAGSTLLRIVVDGAPWFETQAPEADIAPGGVANVHVPFRAPDGPGSHEIRIELIENGAPVPGVRAAPDPILIEVIDVPATRTLELFEIERKHNPWHYNPFVGVAKTRQGHPFPLFTERGKGCHIWDVEGNEYIDFTMGWGSNILGHADPRIVRAIADSLEFGSVLPSPHPYEMEVSQMLVEDFAPHEMVAFGKNGSDVCSIAARLARVVTGKRVILSCGFHGWQDFALEYFRFEDCGVPYRDERSLYKFRFNDTAGFLDLYDRYKHDLAAVMIEPAGPLIDDAVGLGGEPAPDFLPLLADAARRVGALLIFDEIVTGYRYRQGSVQKALGIVPDLTCVGKALASGMPLAAILGPYRHFSSFHKAHFHPTFRGEVHSLAAARAAIGIYRSEPIAEYLWQYGETLRAKIAEVCRKTGTEGGLTGPPYRMAFIFREADARRRKLKRTLLMQELVRHRVMTVSGMIVLARAHDDDAMQRAVDAFRQALITVHEADRANELERRLELIPS